MQTISVKEASEQLAHLVDAAIDGDIVLITTADERTVRLVPITYSKQQRQFGSAKGLVETHDDFNDPLADFAEYMN
ncbi:MAG: type II toxin-antitoxin system Phd/YefM family antitoxin [Herpetosiphon sp.]|nr:type II toxin-antitoxin system Phd/YefM family antitoxin [Herpetosiphon sp.]